MTDNKLSDVQDRFIRAYLNNGCNGTQAYLKVRPDINYQSATVQAGRLLANVQVRQAIDKAKNKEHLKSIASKENILLEMHEVRQKALETDKLQTCLNASAEKAKIQGYYANQDQDLTNYTQILQQLVIKVNTNEQKDIDQQDSTIIDITQNADLPF